MKVYNIADFKSGYFIGDFEPSVLRTGAFEVCYMRHYAGQKWDSHYHAQMTEYNYIIRGVMEINKHPLSQGQLFVLEPYEVSEPIFHTDVELIVVKVPSIPKDKVTYEKT